MLRSSRVRDERSFMLGIKASATPKSRADTFVKRAFGVAASGFFQLQDAVAAAWPTKAAAAIMLLEEILKPGTAKCFAASAFRLGQQALDQFH